MKRKIVLIAAIIVVLFIGYNFVNRIYAALKAGDRLTSALGSLHQVEIKNKDLKDQLKQAASLDFVERQARDKLNYAKEGETVVVIPQSKIEQVLGIAKSVEQRLPNPLGWLKLFFK